MGILDQVAEMRSQGISEAEMSVRLQEQGISPRAINDAFHQEKIRSAVSAEDTNSQYQNNSESFYTPSTQEQQVPQGRIPGLPGEPQNYQDPYQQQQYAQQPQEMYPPQQTPQNYQDPYQQQQQYEQPPQEGYYQDPYAQQEQYPTHSGSTDTMIEISEQVFSEKIKKIEKQVEQFTEFAALAQTKISNNNERIKRMESIMDKLQIAILEKVGSYGKDIGSIKKELEMIEDSFTKVIPGLKRKSHSSKK